MCEMYEDKLLFWNQLVTDTGQTQMGKIKESKIRESKIREHALLPFPQGAN